MRQRREAERLLTESASEMTAGDPGGPSSPRGGRSWPGSRYLVLVVALLVVLLIAFLVVEALGPSLLTDPARHLRNDRATAAGLSLALLSADVLIPVPASLVMIANGAVLGLPLGALVSLVGATLATIVGAALGRGGRPLIERVVPAGERAAAERLISRWGVLALVVTRPVPLLSEATAIMAGAARLPWPAVVAAGGLGSAPAAGLYALAGASSVGSDNGILVFAAVILLAAATWLVGRARTGRPSRAG